MKCTAGTRGSYLRFIHIGFILAVILAAALRSVLAIDIEVGSEAAQIGATGRVDIALNNASGLASAEFVVNYDPAILQLDLVTNSNCSLGTNFTMVSSTGDGSAKIVMVREDGIQSNEGTMAALYFTINPGAKHGMNTEVVVANCELGGDYGVDFSAGGLTASNGQMWAVSSMTQDSDGNGIPDWWEATHFAGITNALSDADDDGDGADNIHEYVAGTDPLNQSDVFRLLGLTPVAAPVGVEIKWSSVGLKQYDIERSTNLTAGFSLLETNLEASATEFMYTDTTATNDTPYFYRIKVHE